MFVWPMECGERDLAGQERERFFGTPSKAGNAYRECDENRCQRSSLVDHWRVAELRSTKYGGTLDGVVEPSNGSEENWGNHEGVLRSSQMLRHLG